MFITRKRYEREFGYLSRANDDLSHTVNQLRDKIQTLEIELEVEATRKITTSYGPIQYDSMKVPLKHAFKNLVCYLGLEISAKHIHESVDIWFNDMSAKQAKKE